MYYLLELPSEGFVALDVFYENRVKKWIFDSQYGVFLEDRDNYYEEDAILWGAIKVTREEYLLKLREWAIKTPYVKDKPAPGGGWK